MKFKSLGSPANLHRNVYELREAEIISLSYSGTNRRTKYLLITQAAYDYFQINSVAMLKAI